MEEKLKLTGGGAIVDCLERERVDYVFGVPGGQALGIMDALFHSSKVRFITAHDERSAACMADGYARMTGRVGVCLVTTGPGATNLLTGVGGAFKDSSPVVLLTANNRGADLQRDDAQEADHVALFRGLTKWSLLVTDVTRIPHAMREGFRRALAGCPGPVHLDFTREILEAETVEFRPMERENYRPTGRVRGDAGEIERAAARFAEAKAPVIWAGRGALVSRATDALVKLAETLDCPLITTYNGIGTIPADHPLFFGPLSRHGTSVTKKIVAESDLVVAIGNSLNAPSTYRWKLELPEQLIQVDIDPCMIGRHYPFSVGVIGDAGSVAGELTALVAQRATPEAVSAGRRGRIEALRGEQNAWRTKVFREEYAQAKPIKPHYLMKVLQECLPRDAIIVGGAGNPGIWTNLLDIHEPGSYIKAVGFGNMGFALPGAIGAKVAHPDRCVASIIGDGSLGMCVSEIETSLREKAPVLIVVMNNLGYGNIKQEQLTYFEGRYIGVDFDDVQFTEVARGYGACGRRVEEPAELAPAVREAVEKGSTYLLDVMIDPHDNVWTEPF